MAAAPGPMPSPPPGAPFEVALEPPRGRIRHAVLDFDGTISSIRDGWQDFMVPMMVEVVTSRNRARSISVFSGAKGM